MPSRPSKNRINMHDIISHPLGVLPDAINAVLRCPEPLDEVEVRSLFEEAEFLLLRLEEALSLGDGDSATALIQLLLEGLSARSEGPAHSGFTAFTTRDGLLSTLHSIFCHIFHNEALPIQSTGAADLAQAVCILCDCEALKEQCGELFMSDLLRVLQDLYDTPSTSNAYFQTQRSVAASLINLLKGSAKNKQRIGDWSCLLACFTMSVDVFFQLQCVEMLYRVSRKKKDLIKKLVQDGAGAYDQSITRALDAIDQLPNDETLLGRMMDLVERADEGRSDISVYSVQQVTAAETTVATSTKSFFTPHYFVVMIASSSADNLTIPYTHIRCVTIAKDSRVSFRLEKFPLNLEGVLHHTAAGMDTVTVFLSADQLAKLKASPVRSWIVHILQKKHQKQQCDSSAAKSTDEPVTSKEPEVDREKLDDRVGEGSDRIATLSSTATQVLEPLAQARAKRHREESSEAEGPAAEKQLNDADAKLRRGIDRVTKGMQAAEKKVFLTTLQRLAESKMELRRIEDVNALNAAIALMQEDVDKFRECSQRRREEYKRRVEVQIAELCKEIQGVEDAAASAVTQLNDGLRAIKSSSHALSERIAGVPLLVQELMNESRMAEEKSVQEMELGFEQELAQAEERELRMCSAVKEEE